jgi:RHS repeat-associated protein
MSCLQPNPANAHWVVGDPIDAISGGNTEIARDFLLPGPVPLDWRRYYDSSCADTRFGLGWGHSHEYERILRFDADGMRYVGPLGRSVSFPPITRVGSQASTAGLTLHRIGELRYQITEADWPAMEFEFRDPSHPAPLNALVRGIARLEFRYRRAGTIEQILDSTGSSVTVESDENGRVLRLTLKGSAGRNDRDLVAYVYDEAGNLVRGVDAYGHTFSFEYDAANRLIRRTDRRGYSFYFSYDHLGRCVHSRGEDGLYEVRLDYRPAERRTIVTESDGGVWEYRCNENGLLSEIADPCGGIREFKYDDLGRITEVVDADGDAWKHLYNQSGTTIGELDPCGRLDASAGAALRKQREALALPDFIPQLASRPTVFMGHVPVSWGHTHFYSNPFRWEFGDLLTIYAAVRPLPEELSLIALPIWARSSVMVRESPPIKAEVVATQPTYPSMGKTLFPPGVHTRDSLGTLVRTKDVEGAVQEWGYDPNGSIVRYRDAERQVWLYEYTSWDQLTREISPTGGVIEYAHTCTELLAQTRDAGGAVGRFRYDLRRRLSEAGYSPSLRSQFLYEASERQAARLDASGRKRLTIRYGSGNLPIEVKDEEARSSKFEYGPLGLCVSAENEHSRAEFAYDDLGNLIRDFRDGRGVHREFDAFELLSTVLFERFAILYVRKPGCLLVTDPTGRQHEFRFLGHGLVRKILSNQTEEISQYQYEGRCLVKVLRPGMGAQRVWSRQYFYSPSGHLILVEDNHEGRSEFSYDADGRLIEGKAGGRRANYGHDAAGNLCGKPGLTEVAFRQGNQMAAANGAALDYDEQGCLALVRNQNGETVWRHNSMGWLVEADLPDGRWEAEYDSLGRRISKTYRGSRTEYYWDGERLAAEVADGGRLRIYIYAHHRSRVPFMFVDYVDTNAKVDSGKCYFIFTNHLGAPVRIKDDSGKAVWQARYEPFGEITVQCQEGFSEFNLRFPGHYADPETGLHYNRFRYYNPSWGRYLEPDPVSVLGGLNLYAYTSDPLSEVDVDGRCPKKTPPLDEDEDSKDRASRMAARIRNELDQNPNQWGFTPHDNITYAVMIVRMADGSTRMVVTANGNRQSLHSELDGVVTSSRFVAPENNPPGDTGHHAEQRAMAWARENSTNPDPSQRVVAIEAISPTRPCCPGCTAAIQRRGDSNLDVVQTPSGVDKSTVI